MWSSATPVRRWALGAGVGGGTVDHVNTVRAHLAGLQRDVHRLRLAKSAVGQALLQRQVVAVVMQVRVQLLLAVRAGDHPKAAVGAAAGLQRQPHRAGGQRADRPAVAVLVPGGLVALARWPAKHRDAPQDHTIAGHTRHQVDSRRGPQVQKRRHALNPRRCRAQLWGGLRGGLRGRFRHRLRGRYAPTPAFSVERRGCGAAIRPAPPAWWPTGWPATGIEAAPSRRRGNGRFRRRSR